jgi:hypothetical protein
MKKQADPYLERERAEAKKARDYYESNYIPTNKSAKAIDPSYHLEGLRKRRAIVIESQKTSDDQQAIADANELRYIDQNIKQLNGGMQWVSSYMRGSVKVTGYWRKQNSFSAPKTNYGLGLPKTAGTGTTR